MPNLHTESHGSGDVTLVMCNGLSQSTANWRSIARQNPQFKWILFDARGHGRSEMGIRPYHIDDHVSDLMRVLEKHGCTNPVLMGFSHGGRVAMRAAAMYPDAFSALILISTGAKQTALRKAHVASWSKCLELGGVEAMAWASLPNIVGIRILNKFPDLGILVKASATRNSPEGLTAMFEGMAQYPPSEGDARRITAPTLIFHGQQDPLVRESDVDDMQSWIPHAKRVHFQEAGHTLPLEEPQRFAAHLGDFLQDALPQLASNESSHP